MHYEIQCLIHSPDGNHDRHQFFIDAGKELEAKLRQGGVGFVIEVRDIRAGKRLFRSIDTKGI
ncbi:hypothetical protein FHS63_003794 [Azospirillum doebereinerae]